MDAVGWHNSAHTDVIVDAGDGDRNSPLFLASQLNWVMVATTPIEHGMNVDAPVKLGRAPFPFARYVARGNLADVAQNQSTRRWTRLHSEACHGQWTLLLMCGRSLPVGIEGRQPWAAQLLRSLRTLNVVDDPGCLKAQVCYPLSYQIEMALLQSVEFDLGATCALIRVPNAFEQLVVHPSRQMSSQHVGPWPSG